MIASGPPYLYKRRVSAMFSNQWGDRYFGRLRFLTNTEHEVPWKAGKWSGMVCDLANDIRTNDMSGPSLSGR